MGIAEQNGFNGINEIDGITDVGHIAFDSELKSNVYEIGNFYVIQVEIPNASYENVKIAIEDKRLLTISVNFPPVNDCVATYHLMEIKEKGMLKRTFVSPFDLDIMKCKTICQNGFLEIVIER